MVGSLAFGFEDDLQEASEVAGGPALLLEPAEIFGGEFVERSPPETSEGHRPSAELFPVGRGLSRIHGGRIVCQGIQCHAPGGDFAAWAGVFSGSCFGLP
jgi:hypothetical protein